MKNIKRVLLIGILLILSLTLFSCEKEGPYGNSIEEDLSTTNIIEDNYRNYYEIFVRSFYDSNGDGIGDLKGVTQKLDYIHDLGFNGIWLMPINPSPSYHKYDVKDYYSVDPSYGTMADLEELISECHKRNIRLILDLVLNHSSTTNVWFTKAKQAFAKSQQNQTLTEEDQKYKDFYSFFTTKPSGKTVYSFGNNYYYEANFDSGMPEFNLDSLAVQNEFKDILKFYLDKGIDGFRLDAVKYYYVDSMSKSIEFLSKLNTWAKEINPNAYIVGECWDSDTTIGKYYESGIDSFFNFSMSVSNPSSPLINSLNLDGKLLTQYYDGLLSNISLANGHIPAPFIDNHDMPRYSSSSDLSINKDKFKFALLQMMNGSTFTYYGSEVGMVGTNAGDSNPDQNVRIPIYWGEAEGQCSPLGGATIESYPHGTVKYQMKAKNSTYQFYKKCLLIRNQNPEIARGDVTLVEKDTETKLLFIKKTYNGSEIGIIFNFSATESLNVNYIDQGFNKVVGQLVTDSKNTYIGSHKDNSITLPPYSIAIVK